MEKKKKVKLYDIEYEECEYIWDKVGDGKLSGEIQHISYVARKLGVKSYNHPELKGYWERYKRYKYGM